MSEFLVEPELTRVIQEIGDRGMDVISLLESTEQGVRWRNGNIAKPDPITARDKEILDMNLPDYDAVQITLSKIEPAYDSTERRTYKTRILPVEAVKNYLGRRRYGPSDSRL